MSLKYRILTILGLCLVSLWFLFPRNVTVRERGPDGLLHDVTRRRVPLQRGLDLKGGTYIALEVNDSAQQIPADQKAEAIDRAMKVVRTRIDGFGVSETVVQKQGNDRIVVQIPGIQDPERARKVVEEVAVLKFNITDKTQALERALPRLDQLVKQRGLAAKVATGAAAETAPASKGLQGLLKTADTAKKTDTSKAGAASDSAKAADSLKVQPGGAFSSLLEQGQIPGQFYVESSKTPTLENYLADSVVHNALPPGKDFLPGMDSIPLQGKTYKTYYLVDSKPIITGDYLINARPNQSPTEGTIVEFTLTNEGGRRFRNETGRHVGDYMAIVLDNRVMTAPVINSAIGTRGQITMGGKDLAAAQDLSLVLRAGALPVPLRVAEQKVIGPSLGQDSIDKGTRAAVIAVVLVVVIMLVYYRFSGLLAVGGLVLYVLY
ncbi:MAG TPA: hypothetical protein VIP11_20215, partial [Gemmatimonadaceae bacterium]